MRFNTYKDSALEGAKPVGLHGQERVLDDYTLIAANAILAVHSAHIEIDTIDTQRLVTFAKQYPTVDTFIGDREKLQEFTFSLNPVFADTLNLVWSKISPHLEDHEIHWLVDRWLKAAAVFYDKGEAMADDKALLDFILTHPKLLVFFLIGQLPADTLRAVDI